MDAALLKSYIMTEQDLKSLAIEGINSHLKNIYSYFTETTIKNTELKYQVEKLKQWRKELK
jgi:hypothetical protein